MKKGYTCTYLTWGICFGLLIGTLINIANTYITVSIGALVGSLIDLFIFYKNK